MIVNAKPKLENGDVESDDEDEKIVDTSMMNGTLRESRNRGLDLSRSFTAREKRRNAVSILGLGEG
jgi:hypothetical protein